jgi:hypothetical protein
MKRVYVNQKNNLTVPCMTVISQSQFESVVSFSCEVQNSQNFSKYIICIKKTYFKFIELGYLILILCLPLLFFAQISILIYICVCINICPGAKLRPGAKEGAGGARAAHGQQGWLEGGHPGDVCFGSLVGRSSAGADRWFWARSAARPTCSSE